MKLLMYEWKKLWKRKIIWVFTVLLLLLNAGLFLQDYLVEGWINADLYEAKFYYADRFGGDISQNTIQEVQDLMSRLENGEAPPSPGRHSGGGCFCIEGNLQRDW